jgi:hypothetical protein
MKATVFQALHHIFFQQTIGALQSHLSKYRQLEFAEANSRITPDVHPTLDFLPPSLHLREAQNHPANMCKYCKLSIFTPTDISDLLRAYRTAQQIYPTRTLVQQLAANAKELQLIWEPKGEMGLPEKWDWRKLAGAEAACGRD